MTANHVMLDLETWGIKPGCALRSIGAVAFDPYTKEIGPTFYRNIDRSSCEGAGLIVEHATEEWWRAQSRENPRAVTALHDEPQLHLRAVAADFNAWWKGISAEFVWSHGANFDEVIWRVAVEAAHFSVPWNYRNVRDTRTLFWLTSTDPKELPFVGVQHYALDDALNMARAIQIAMTVLPTITAFRAA
jgi:hypothetical protein